MQAIRPAALTTAALRLRLPRLTGTIATLIACSAFSAAAESQVLMQPNISAAQARRMVDAIIAECSEGGELLTVTIAIVDRAGQPVLQIRGDTASPHNWELAFRKAYTARTYRRTTLDWRDRTAGGSPLAGQRLLSNVVPLGGGVPIMQGADALGGVGVSGSSAGQEGDNACAEAGIAAIAEDLD